MSISGIGSSGMTTSLTAAQQRPAGPGKEIRQGIDQMKKALESGDLEATQKAYDSLSSLQDGTRAADENDPLTKMLSSVGEALKTGDISQVQQAFEASGPKGSRSGGGSGGSGGPQGGRPPGPPPEVADAMGQLSQSLQSGDMSSAQSAYSALADALGTAQNGNSASGSSASGGSASDRFTELLGQLGSALESGSLSSAKSLFSSLAPRGSQGVNITA